MNSFLKEVAGELTSKFKDFKDLILILPNKRSGIFLKNELLKQNTHTTYAPEIYNIEAFIEKLARLKTTENIQLLFEFYETYKKVTPTEKRNSFHDFSQWAQIIVKDFSEIDKHLGNPEKILSYLSAIKEINHWYLQEEKTALQKNYIQFWNNLKVYYINLKAQLLQKNIGYQGLIYREAANNSETYLKKNPEKHHIFIGFNALNKAEEKLIHNFLNYPNNTILWDADEAFLSDPDHSAGLFIRTYKKEWNHFKTNPFKITSNTFKNKKNIQIIGIPKAVGQAKYVGRLVHDISKSNTNIANTAIVLGNENLLPSILNTIPETIKSVNITCGLPLYQTPVASFFNTWFHLIESSKENTWYYKNVLNILSHPLTRQLLYKEKDYSSLIIKNIQQENTIFVSLNDIKKQLPESLSEINNHIFIDAKQLHVHTIIEKCIALIYRFREKYHKDRIHLEYLHKFHRIFNQILRLNTTYHSISNSTALKNSYRELLHEEKIHFTGAPLKGLQIMGMLESRNLDFENLIITSVNEGILPSGKQETSFLPFEIKNAFQLPTYKEKDAIYTYHFYRLLQRAKNIYLLYNTEPDAIEGGEKSRFLLQLISHKHPNHTLKEIIATPQIIYTSKPRIEVRKNNHIIQLLKNTAKKGFAPTSLSNYVRNPIDFYHTTVLGLKTRNEMEETITAKTLGTVIHNTLEELYKPLEGKALHKTNILKMKKDTDAVVTHNFKQLYKEKYVNQGKNLISYAIVKRYIQHFLNLELNRLNSGASIKILHIEKQLTTKIHIPELNLTTTLKGTIDRVEEVNGTINIIDYKTGRVRHSDIEIVDEQELISDYKYHKAFQLLCYTYLYKENYASKAPFEATILSFKNLKSGYLKFSKKDKHGRGAQKTTAIDQEILNLYENTFKALVTEIFDINTPFTAKET